MYIQCIHVYPHLHVVQQKREQVDYEGHVDDHEDIVTSRLVSKFHFVDLAGSERFARTRNKGERFKGTHCTCTCNN